MRAALLLALLLFAGIVSGQMYRWTDEHGRTHFSDRPPANLDADEMDAPQASVIETDAETRGRQERLQRLQRAQQEKQQVEDQQASEQDRQRRQHFAPLCQKARIDLQRMQGRVMYRNPDGSLRDVSLAEVARDKEQLEQWIEHNCKGL
jgi:hypothetical protein